MKDYFQYVGVANITQPRFMLRPRYHVITCAGSPADGVLPFRSVPFCYPNDEAPNRASCLHAALHGAMLLKSEAYSYTPMSSYDMFAFMWGRLKDQTLRTKLSKKGASLIQALEVLRHEDTGAGAILEMISVRALGRAASAPATEGSEGASDVKRRPVVKEAWRCMMDYLSNGIPLIVEEVLGPSGEAVDGALESVEDAAGEGDERAHAILVNGMRLLDDPEDGVLEWISAEERPRVDYAELPGRFVIHDIFDGPFTERVAPLLLNSAWVDDPEKPENSGISFLAVAPRHAHLSISQVRGMARANTIARRHHMKRFWCDYLETVFGIQPADESQVKAEKKDADRAKHEETKLGAERYVTRLLLTSQVKQRYLSDLESEDEGSEDGGDRNIEAMRVNLEHARKCLDRVALRRVSASANPAASGEEEASGGTGESEKRASSQRYWWCVEVREPKLERESARHRESTQERESNKRAHGYWRMPPALAYLWPIDLDVTSAKDQKPWIEIVFAGEMDRMHYQFRVRFEQSEAAVDSEEAVDVVITQHSA
jgi:hypothetical protein